MAVKTKEVLDAKSVFESIGERTENDDILAPGQRVYIKDEDKYYKKMKDGSWEEDGGECQPIDLEVLMEDIENVFGGRPVDVPEIDESKYHSMEEIISAVKEIPLSAFPNNGTPKYCTVTYVNDEITKAINNLQSNYYTKAQVDTLIANLGK